MEIKTPVQREGQDKLKFMLERTIPFSSRVDPIISSLLFYFAADTDYNFVDNYLVNGNATDSIGGNDSWIQILSVAKFDPKNHILNPFANEDDEDELEYLESLVADDGFPTHVARVVTRSQWDHGDMEIGTVTSIGGIVKPDGEIEMVTETSDGSNWMKKEPLDLVDGTHFYFKYDPESQLITPVWTELWEGSQPDYYGGPIPGAMIWASEIGQIQYICDENPFLEIPEELHYESHYEKDHVSFMYALDQLVELVGDGLQAQMDLMMKGSGVGFEFDAEEINIDDFEDDEDDDIFDDDDNDFGNDEYFPEEHEDGRDCMFSAIKAAAQDVNESEDLEMTQEQIEEVAELMMNRDDWNQAFDQSLRESIDFIIDRESLDDNAVPDYLD